MKSIAILSLSVLFLGCVVTTSGVPSSTDPGAPTTPSTAPAASTPAVATPTASSTAQPTPTVSPAASSLQVVAPQVEVQTVGALTPPAEVGKANFENKGCFTLAKDGEKGMKATRSATTPSFVVSTLGNGFLVAHTFGHACCLDATSTSKLDGKTVTLTQTLVGQACRCRCESTIRSAVRVDPGEYELIVQVVQANETKEVHRQKVTVPALSVGRQLSDRM